MLATVMSQPEKPTIAHLRTRKKRGEKTAMLTCYDYSTARLMSAAGVDTILVGDTYGEVCLGFPSTLPVKLDDLLVVTAAVRRGAESAYLVGDMPFFELSGGHRRGRPQRRSVHDRSRLRLCQG